MKDQQVQRPPIELVGSICQVHWTSTHQEAIIRDPNHLFVVRGKEADVICLELLDDFGGDSHRQPEISWVPMSAIQYLSVLSAAAVKRRMEQLGRLAFEDAPKD